jgi:6-pyruvoyl-tetrahydropterin synthase
LGSLWPAASAGGDAVDQALTVAGGGKCGELHGHTARTRIVIMREDANDHAMHANRILFGGRVDLYLHLCVRGKFIIKLKPHAGQRDVVTMTFETAPWGFESGVEVFQAKGF